jgi:hypothetical protein
LPKLTNLCKEDRGGNYIDSAKTYAVESWVARNNGPSKYLS